MSTQEKLSQVLAHIRAIMDNNEKLTQVLEFLETEIWEEETTDDDSSNTNHLEQVPGKYRKPIKEIADYMGANLISYFNHQIHNSDYREDWFAFRQKELEKYVINNYFYDLNN